MALLLLAAGCAAPAESGSDVPLPDPLPRVTPASVLPFEAYTLSADERSELFAVRNALVVECAREHGVTLTLVHDDPVSLGHGLAMWAGRFGTLPLEQAREHGYHAPPEGPATQPFTVFVREDEQPRSGVITGEYDASTTRAVDAAGAPLPDGGCRGVADARLGGDPDELGSPSAEEIRLEAARDPRSVEAMDDWRRCMEERGYAFVSVDEPYDLALGNELTDEERAVAVADVQCTGSSRWRDITFAIETELQERALRREPDRYRERHEHELAMLAAARSIAPQR
ncbi:hypothetical protein [Nocardioides zeae]|uniref:hypothetical protein n=1 Tax=Nocardioides zeae TaxID=1457234 RepID=UPI00286BC12B|nr:hypothetical protein [Nocardioides zeae]